MDILMSRDEPLELQPNPYDPHLVDTTHLHRNEAAGVLGSESDAPDGDVAASVHEITLDRHDVCDSARVGAAMDSACAARASMSDACVTSSVAASVQSRSLAEIDEQLMDLALDHDWDECNSLADFGLLGDASARSLRASVAAATRGMLPSRAADAASSTIESSVATGSTTGSSRTGSALGSANTSTNGTHTGSAAGRNVQMLPAIPERTTVDSTAAGTGASAGAASSDAGGDSVATGAGAQRGKKESRHDSSDYLRPMREQRELETLCATVPVSLTCANAHPALRYSSSAQSLGCNGL